MSKKTTLLTLQDCEDSFHLTLEEISHSFNVSSELIIEIVNEGIVETKGELESWQFDNQDIQKLRKAIQLHQDLRLNPAGACLALELIEEIERLNILLNK